MNGSCEFGASPDDDNTFSWCYCDDKRGGCPSDAKVTDGMKWTSCKTDCEGRFASVFMREKILPLKIAGEGHVEWEISYHMKRATQNDESKGNVFWLKSFQFRTTQDWIQLNGSEFLGIGKKMPFVLGFHSGKIRIAFDDFSLKQNAFLEECDVGKFGENCDKLCRCNIVSVRMSCDRISGFCTNGCKSGYFGLDCQASCECQNGGKCQSSLGECD